MFDQFATGSDLGVETPPPPTREELLVATGSWKSLQDIWDNLYCFVDFHRDAILGGLSQDDNEFYSRPKMAYVRRRFQKLEKDVEVLRKRLWPEEKPFMEEHLDVVLWAIKEHKAKFFRVVSAIDDFVQIDEKKWEKRMPVTMKYKRYVAPYTWRYDKPYEYGP